MAGQDGHHGWEVDGLREDLLVAFAAQVVAMTRGPQPEVVAAWEGFPQGRSQLRKQSAPLGVRERVLRTPVSLDGAGEPIRKQMRLLLDGKWVSADVGLPTPTKVALPSGPLFLGPAAS